VIIPAMRGSDAQGKGYFGAPRGDRTHKGASVSWSAHLTAHPVQTVIGPWLRS